MAQKKVTKNSRISPSTIIDPEGVSFASLKYGDCFIYHNGLFIKTDDDNSQTGVNLLTGEAEYDMCTEVVIPVDVKITWKKK